MHANVQQQGFSHNITPPFSSPLPSLPRSVVSLRLHRCVSLFILFLHLFAFVFCLDGGVAPFLPAVVAMTTPLVGNGTSFNIAVIVNCVYANYTDVTFPMQLPDDFDITLCATGVSNSSNYNDFSYRGYETFRRVVNENGGGIPINGHNISLKITYFNVGGIDYLQSDYSAMLRQYGQVVQNIAILTQQLGLYGGYNYTSNTWGAPCRFCTFPYDNNPLFTPGIYKTRFPVVITPPFGDNIPSIIDIPSLITNTPFRACQLSKECIAISHFAGFNEWLACVPSPQYVYSPNSTVPSVVSAIPNECTKAVDPSLPSDKRLGARRFEYGFSALPVQDGILRESIAWFKLHGAQTAILIITSQQDYLSIILEPGLAQLRANKIQLLMPQLYFPANGAYLTDEQIASIVDSVVTLDPDLFILLPHGTLQNDIQGSIGLLRGLRDREYVPRAVVIPGGSTAIIAAALSADPNAKGVWDPVTQTGTSDGAYIYGTTYFDPQLRGYQYNAINEIDPANTRNDWEPFPTSADGTILSPAVFTLTYCHMWNVSESVLSEGFLWPVLEAMPIVMATKLFYAAGGSDLARDLQLASFSISVPSIGGMIQFDSFGRLVQSGEYVVQYGRTGVDYHLITPLDVASQPDVYPTPTYAERIPPNKGAASFLGTYQERAVVVITCLANLYLLALMAGVISQQHTPLMRASSPIFCVLMLLGGIICISSNYVHSLYAYSSACGVYMWFLTVGFTLMFASLHTKNLRIFRIYQSAKLRVITVSNRELFTLLSSLVGIDIIVNAIWSGWVGFPVEYVSVDPYRPRYDYIQCQYKADSRTTGFLLFHLVEKACMIFSGIILSYLGRDIPALYNEAWYVAGSMYNCTLLLCFLVPLVVTQVGSRLTTYLISSYGILVVVVSTASILFLPKFHYLYKMKRKSAGSPAEKTPPSTHVPNLPFEPKVSHLATPRGALTNHDLEQVVKLSAAAAGAKGLESHVEFEMSPLTVAQRSNVFSRMNNSARDDSSPPAEEPNTMGVVSSRGLISGPPPNSEHLSNQHDPHNLQLTTSDSADSSLLPQLDAAVSCTASAQVSSSGVSTPNKLNRPIPPIVRMHKSSDDEASSSEQSLMWQKLCSDLQFQNTALKAENCSLREQLQDMYLFAQASSSTPNADQPASDIEVQRKQQKQTDIAASPTEADSHSDEDIPIIPRFVEESRVSISHRADHEHEEKVTESQSSE